MPMGARSKLVLLKLGFDMRGHYEALLSEPIPSKMRSLILRMAGSLSDVIESRQASDSGRALGPRPPDADDHS